MKTKHLLSTKIKNSNFKSFVSFHKIIFPFIRKLFVLGKISFQVHRGNKMFNKGISK